MPVFACCVRVHSEAELVSGEVEDCSDLAFIRWTVGGWPGAFGAVDELEPFLSSRRQFRLERVSVRTLSTEMRASPNLIFGPFTFSRQSGTRVSPHRVESLLRAGRGRFRN